MLINVQLEQGEYEEIIAFSLDCEDVQATDVKLRRQPDGTFEPLDTSLFISVGNYEICWKSSVIDHEAYVKASDFYWTVRDNPNIYNPVTDFKLNSNLEVVTLSDSYLPTDEFMLVEGSID